MEDVEVDWNLIGDESTEPIGEHSAAPKKMRKPFALNNLFINTKSKFYNFCKPMSKTLPSFSNSPLVMLGVTYQASLRVSSQAKARSRPVGDSKPQLYTFFNKLSVVPWTEPAISSQPTAGEVLPSHILSFLQDFRSRVWLTYRSNFPAIEGTNLVTDMGWGCMLRTGQMLLAQALVTHYLGRDWRVQTEENMMTYRELLRWFADEPSLFSPYSIHNIARVGHSQFGKQIGDWFEPTTIAETLKYLVHQHSPDIKMYVPKDGIISKQDVYQLCVMQPADGPARHSPRRTDDEGLESSSDAARQFELMSSAESESEYIEGTSDAPEQTWSPLVILVPLRLGIQCLNPIYIPTLKAFFSLPQSLGIIGGKPHSSFYFVGFQDNKVLYMDPHFVQPAVKMEADPLFPTESYRMEIPQSMAFTDIDPSLALGFFCSTQADFDNFCDSTIAVGRSSSCIFSVAEQNNVYKGSSSSSSSSSSPSAGSCTIILDGDSEEYVLL